MKLVSSFAWEERRRLSVEAQAKTSASQLGVNFQYNSNVVISACPALRRVRKL